MSVLFLVYSEQFPPLFWMVLQIWHNLLLLMGKHYVGWGLCVLAEDRMQNAQENGQNLFSERDVATILWVEFGMRCPSSSSDFSFPPAYPLDRISSAKRLPYQPFKPLWLRMWSKCSKLAHLIQWQYHCKKCSSQLCPLKLFILVLLSGNFCCHS